MTKVSTSGDKLIVEMLGWDKLWSLKSRLEVPLAHVGGVRKAAGERVRGLRMPGTYIPGLIIAGTFEHGGQREFWAVHNAQQAVAIVLHNEFFSKLVVQVPDPAATVEAIQKVLAPVSA